MNKKTPLMFSLFLSFLLIFSGCRKSESEKFVDALKRDLSDYATQNGKIENDADEKVNNMFSKVKSCEITDNILMDIPKSKNKKLKNSNVYVVDDKYYISVIHTNGFTEEDLDSIVSRINIDYDVYGIIYKDLESYCNIKTSCLSRRMGNSFINPDGIRCILVSLEFNYYFPRIVGSNNHNVDAVMYHFIANNTYCSILGTTIYNEDVQINSRQRQLDKTVITKLINNIMNSVKVEH